MKFGDLLRTGGLIKPKFNGVNEGEFTRALYYYRKEFGLSFKELKDEPIPSFILFMDEMKKENERQEKEMKKGKRR